MDLWPCLNCCSWPGTFSSCAEVSQLEQPWEPHIHQLLPPCQGQEGRNHLCHSQFQFLMLPGLGFCLFESSASKGMLCLMVKPFFHGDHNCSLEGSSAPGSSLGRRWHHDFCAPAHCYRQAVKSGSRAKKQLPVLALLLVFIAEEELPKLPLATPAGWH